MLSQLSRSSALALLLAGAAAQQAVDRRVCSIARVEPAAAPRIDGILTDACWQDAPAIGDLTMVEPWLGRRPTDRTVVRLLHDRDNLYIALWCYQDPAGVRATQRVRDARLDPDDRVEILLDPFENRRTAYFFQIGAGGSLGDALVSANGGRFNKPWDAIWRGAARITDDGWVAEIAIPFRSIPRREGARSWGFNLRRYVRGRNEEYQWANPSQSVPFFRVSELGTIDGFGEVDGGIGLELVPYVSAALSRDRTRADDGFDFDPDAGGEIYYRLSPSVTLATTVLTDFAQTENDGRQINLNRFPLFFPEKRDFFLDGVSYYNFGSRFAGGTQFLPYFTRRIGLSDGNPIPILFGLKLTGEAGPFEIGLLDVQTDSADVLDDGVVVGSVDQENLAVGRLKYALGQQTTVGLIATNGNPDSTGANSVFGVDFYHRLPEFVGDMDLQLTVDAIGSTGEAADDDGESFGIELISQGVEWQVQAGTRWVSDDFLPALGFVRRRGTRQSQLAVEYNPRLAEGSDIRRYEFGVRAQRSESWQGEPQEMLLSIDRIGLQFQNDDRISLFASHNFERIDQDFTLFRQSTTVFAGDYEQTRGGLRVSTSEARSWNGQLQVSTGDFFDGSSTSISAQVDWRASALAQIGTDYDTTAVDLGPGRAFTTQIVAVRLDLFFSPELSLRNLAQFDNESNVIGWQSRLRWIYSPGCDFFAVLGTAWQREEDDSIVPTRQDLNLKIAHTLRF